MAEDAARFFRPEQMFFASELASVRWQAGLLLAGAALLLTGLTLRQTPVRSDWYHRGIDDGSPIREPVTG